MGTYQLKSGEEEVYDRVDGSKGFVAPEVREILLAEAGGSDSLRALYQIVSDTDKAPKDKKAKAAVYANLQRNLSSIPGVNTNRVAAEIKSGTDPRVIATSVLMEYVANN